MDTFRVVDADFLVGRHNVRQALGQTDNVSVLTQAWGRFGAQLLLRRPSALPSGRVPLYLCPCGDLGCGALTVAVTRAGDVVRWSDFGSEVDHETGLFQSPFMRRFGPFTFAWEDYRDALSGYP